MVANFSSHTQHIYMYAVLWRNKTSAVDGEYIMLRRLRKAFPFKIIWHLNPHRKGNCLYLSCLWGSWFYKYSKKYNFISKLFLIWWKIVLVHMGYIYIAIKMQYTNCCIRTTWQIIFSNVDCSASSDEALTN